MMRLPSAPLATLVVVFLPVLANAQHNSSPLNGATPNAANNPPLNVNVTNTPLAITANAPLAITANAPLPVMLVSPVVGTSVTCSWDLGSNGGGPITTTSQKGFPLSGIKCPSGTIGLDVQRVIYDPYGGSLPSSNVASYMLTLAIGTITGTTGSFTNLLSNIPNPNLFAIFTQGAPEKTFTEPVRISLTSLTSGYALNGSCSSGIAALNSTCGGLLYIIGVPVQ